MGKDGVSHVKLINYFPIDHEINAALSLDLLIFPRCNHRNPKECIMILKNKQANAKEKLIVLLTAKRWGCKSQEKSYMERTRIIRAASRLVVYDNGYRNEFGTRTINRWDSSISAQITVGSPSRNVGSQNHQGSISVTDAIENIHPGYLRYLFRVSIKAKGLTSTFSDIAYQMHATSNIPSKTRLVVNLSKWQVREWFGENHGKEISPKEKPLDTEEHCEKRTN